MKRFRSINSCEQAIPQIAILMSIHRDPLGYSSTVCLASFPGLHGCEIKSGQRPGLGMRLLFAHIGTVSVVLKENWEST